MERTETRQQRAKARNHLARREAAFGARRIARRQTVAALEDVIDAYGSLVGGVELIAYVDVVVAVGSCAYDGGPPSMAEPQGMATLSSIMSIFGRGT